MSLRGKRYCSLQHNFPKDDVLLHRENICDSRKIMKLKSISASKILQRVHIVELSTAVVKVDIKLSVLV